MKWILVDNKAFQYKKAAVETIQRKYKYMVGIRPLELNGQWYIVRARF